MATHELKQKAMLQKTVIILFLIFVSAPAVSFANGGDQRIVEGKYLINLSRAPFTPRVGEKTSFLASFVDMEKNKLIAEDLLVTIRIAKLGGEGSAKRTFLFEQKNTPVKGGILDFSHTFVDAGLHEVFFDFAFVSDPQAVYEAPDFLLDVQKGEATRKSMQLGFLAGAMGVVFGFAFGWFAGLGKRK